MNHPKRDEWIPLLFGEADAAAQRLEAHLQSCPDCAREVGGWQRSIRRLDAWKLPPARRGISRSPARPLAWAAAAAIALAAFIAGRATMHGDERQLRAALRAEMQSALDERFDRAAAHASNTLAEAEERVLAAATHQNKQLAADFVQAINTIRSEDRRATEALFQKIQEQHATDFVLLRRDLETLASATDEELQSARMKLFQVAAAAEKTEQ